MNTKKNTFYEDLFRYRLKKLRNEKDITQKELANLLNVDQSTITKWELGKQQPSIEKLNILAEIFNVDINYLLGKDIETIKILDYFTNPNNFYEIQWLTQKEMHELTNLINNQNKIKEKNKNNNNLNYLNQIINYNIEINNIILNNKKIKNIIIDTEYYKPICKIEDLTYINNGICSKLQKYIIDEILNLNDSDVAKLDLYLYHIKRNTKNESVMRMVANLHNENDLNKIEGYCLGKDEQIYEKANSYKKIFKVE